MVVAPGKEMKASDITDLTFFPIGMILMYDGTDWINGRGGWYICDGTNNTPDLRDKFIKGNGSETQPGANWQQLSELNLPGHSHTLTTNGNHTHTVTVHDTNHSYTPSSTDYSSHEYGEYHSAAYTTSSNGNHTHTVGSTGSGEAFNNMPSYYAVIYIKKIV